MGKVVTRASFELALTALYYQHTLAVDTETLGLKPYQGDDLFSIIIGAEIAYYFNFYAYAGVDPEYVLLPGHFKILNDRLFSDPEKRWYFHNAKFDLAMLARAGIEVKGEIHCTKAMGRVVYNAHAKYDLASSLERIGLTKDDTVEKYIADHKLWDKVEIPGKKIKETKKYYNKVPFDIIVPYGIKDAEGTYALGQFQNQEVVKHDALHDPHLPTLLSIVKNERKLTKTVFEMERLGVKIDRGYCMRASRYETDRMEKAKGAFKTETGKDFQTSTKLFQGVFFSEKDKWAYTEKNNPSFESGTLEKFVNPAAKHVLEYRDAKSKADFYNGFLYHADSSDVIHPNFNPDVAVHGRFSSSSPNLQNLTNEEDVDLSQEFLVRRAIIPRPGFVFIMPDYDQMEYKMMLDQACDFVGHLTPLAEAVQKGKDVHEATALFASELGAAITRKEAKASNFLTIYGGGDGKLALTLGCTIQQAKRIRMAIRRAAPEIDTLVSDMSWTARTRGYVINWAGRRCHFPNDRFSYRAPNYLIAGGCADVMKFAMNRIADTCSKLKSRMVLTLHDEVVCEIHESEILTTPKKVKDHMESVYSGVWLKLTSGMEWSAKSLADKQKGFPV